MEESERLHPLVRKRHEIYRTWWGALMRSDDCRRPLMDCSILILGFLLFSPFSMTWIFWGFLLGTFFEYWTHRSAFHELWKKRFFRSIEDIHMPHHFEKDDGINAGPFFYFPFIVFCWAFFFAMSSDFLVSNSLMVGVLAWFCLYEIFHDLEHQRDHFPRRGQKDPAPYVRFMTEFHRVHHERNWKKNFGVTSPVWDKVFRTYQSPDFREEAAIEGAL